jgi:hypothetical protein
MIEIRIIGKWLNRGVASMQRSAMRAKEYIFETLWLCCRVTLGSLLQLGMLLLFVLLSITVYGPT